MTAVQRIERSLPAFAITVAAVLLFSGLATLGLWDPWELDAADRAKDIANIGRVPAWSGASIRAGFALFGHHEWAGRIVGALGMFAMVLSAMALARRVVDARGAAYAGVVAATTPFTIFHSELMLGDGLAIGAQSLLGLAVVGLVSPWSADEARRRKERAGFLVLAVASGFVAVQTRGVLLGVLAPLVAIFAVLATEPPSDREGRLIGVVLAATALVLALGTAWAVKTDAGTYSFWLGGIPVGGSPPAFDVGIENVFHALAPWSPLLCVAAARTITDESEHARTKRMFVLWAAFAWVAYVVFSSRYGLPTFLAVAPLAALGGACLREIEDDATPDRVSAVVVLLLTGLIIRDFALYPTSALSSLPVDGLSIPGGFDPRKQWAVVLVLVNAPLALSLAMPSGTGKLVIALLPHLTFDFRRERMKSTITLIGAVFSVASILSGVVLRRGGADMGLSSQAVRFGPVLIALPFVLAVLYVMGELVRAYWRLGRVRMSPAVLAGVLFGCFVAFSFSRDVSAHFSPVDLYETYTELRQDGDVLLDFHTGGRASKYYAPQPILILTDQGQLIQKLSENARRWAIFPRGDLPTVDREFRRLRNKHLFVVDATSERFVLVTNSPVQNRRNESPLADSIRNEAPQFQHPVGAVFGNAIELLGYDLELPGGDSVGPGQTFHVTWYWKARARAPGAYTVFLHVDGEGNRLNGDHIPVNGLVPVASWDEGDVIVDRQELMVPRTFRTGTYRFYIGFFAGESRLPVTARPGGKDSENRAIAGTLQVR